MSIETQLREALAARADDVGPAGEDAYARVSGAIRTSQRRRRTAYAGVMAAVVALAVVVPGLLRPGTDRTTTPATHTSSTVPGPADPRWRALSTWPTRGSLAADRSFMDGVASQFGAGHPLFADDVRDQRVVVTVSPSADSPDGEVTLLLGSRGAAASDLRLVARGPAAGPRLVLARLAPDAAAPLVVLTTPNVPSVQVSPRAVIAPDGTTSRAPWVAHPLRDGAAVLTMRDAPGALTRVQAAGYDGPANLVMGTGALRDGGPAICVDLCPGFEENARLSLQDGVATTFGVPVSDVHTSVIYSGPVDARVAGAIGVEKATSGRLRLLVTLSHLPGGAVVRDAILVHSAVDGTGQVLDLESAVPVDAATADVRPYAITGPMTQGSALFEVFAPRAAEVRLASAQPTIYLDSKRAAVRQGRALLRVEGTVDTSQYTVVGYDSRGLEQGRWPVSEPADPYDLYPS